jgi:hypothetical protein
MTDEQPKDRWMGKEIKDETGKDRFSIYLAKPARD